jgi:hypothetical protein
MGIIRWKLQREVRRIGQQLRAIPEFFVEPFQRKRHDANREIQLRHIEGMVGPKTKVALLLLYQPSGVSAATRWTCEHLVRKGYAPLIISNAPLSPTDRALLTPVCWRMAERPNFGYDFGGYRDGIWLLGEWGVDPEFLIILNDSIWFPICEEETMIDQMESSPADFVGALQLDPMRQTTDVPSRKRPFFGSFFLMVKRKAWQHAAFQTFWSGYRNTSNKYKTIRRGERAFSHAMMDAGITSEAIYTRSALEAFFHSLDNHALCQQLRDLVTADERIERDIAACTNHFTDSQQWRTAAFKLALRATEKQNILATAPIISLTAFKVPYLKKSRDRNNLMALEAIHKRVQRGELGSMHPSVRQELQNALL